MTLCSSCACKQNDGWYMENPKQKVELDDIVGLVKIDEPTDSVQLQKEAQLSICEKKNN